MSLHDDLKAYLDGELPAERMAEMREAIDHDPILAREAEAMSGISGALRMAASQPSAVGLEETLKALSRADRRPWWPWLAPLAVGAAALLFVVLPVRQSTQMDFARGETVAMRSTADASKSSVPEAALEDFDAVAPSANEVAKSERVATSRPLDSNGRIQVKNGGALGAQSSAKAHGKGAAVGGKHMKGLSPASIASKGEARRPAGVAAREKTGASLPPMASAGAEAQESRSKPSVTQLAAPVLGVAESEPEPLVIEVESIEEAEIAIRDLAGRMGAEVKPAAPDKKEAADAAMIAKSQSRQGEPDRRIVLEVDEDRLEEARKRVPDVVRDARVRRETQTYSNRGFGGAGGGGGFGGGASPQGPNRQQGDAGQNIPPSRQGPAAAQNQGQGGGQGGQQGGRGGGRDQGPPAPGGAQYDAASQNQKRARYGNQLRSTEKPRRRLQIVLKVKSKVPGKLEE